MRNRRIRLPFRAGAVLGSAIVLVCATLAAVPSLRLQVLRSTGELLVANDPLRPVDVIVISVDADGAGVLEAADLVRGGIATRVAVFADPPDATDREFLRRGVEYHDAAALSVRQLHALGVVAVEVIPRSVSGTHDEGEILPAWCIENGYHSVVFVPLPDHARRVRRVLHREMAVAHVIVLVRPSRFARFDPSAWWRSREGVRTEAIEIQKLILDILLHPLT